MDDDSYAWASAAPSETWMKLLVPKFTLQPVAILGSRPVSERAFLLQLSRNRDQEEEPVLQELLGEQVLCNSGSAMKRLQLCV